ncbi:MAG: aminotransferase class I/II-fold pyridoxal phosphate-dependent enzyme [Bacteroidota bacterium]|nr:aminotransferase class I/II-fold pyridoxal phosphate-dependent enzyme [Bacteroidota bacterium]
MEIANRLNGIGEYYFSQKLREIAELNRAGKNVINLGIGSPDLPPHPDVIQTLNEESQKGNVHGYQSYNGILTLRIAMSDWYHRWYGVALNPDTEILPLMGSKEGILHICMTYLNDGDQVLIPNPGYPTYQSAVKLAGGVCMEYELKSENGFVPDFDLLEKSNLNNVKIMFVNYPHMPTGQLPTKKLFEDIVAFGIKHHILMIHDNPYSFILNENPISLLAVEHAKDCVIELNSLSKSHNMAGWRVGMLCGAKERISDVLRFKSNMDSGMFLPLQLAAAKALCLDDSWHRTVNEVYQKRRLQVFQLLDVLNCKYSKQQAGLFVWASIPASYHDSYAISDDILYKANVFITPGGIFGSMGEKYVRVSLCNTEEKIKEAIHRIQEVQTDKSVSHV